MHCCFYCAQIRNSNWLKLNRLVIIVSLRGDWDTRVKGILQCVLSLINVLQCVAFGCYNTLNYCTRSVQSTVTE